MLFIRKIPVRQKDIFGRITDPLDPEFDQEREEFPLDIAKPLRRIYAGVGRRQENRRADVARVEKALHRKEEFDLTPRRKDSRLFKAGLR